MSGTRSRSPAAPADDIGNTASDHRSKEVPMLGPNAQTHQMATHMYDERLAHAARIRLLSSDRKDNLPVDRDHARRVTVARLAASAAGVVLTFVLAASAAATNPAVGGGAILIR
jgi:hypothetical protein